jgi:hypothetical protein
LIRKWITLPRGAGASKSVKRTVASVNNTPGKEKRDGAKVKVRRGRWPVTVAVGPSKTPGGKPGLETLEELIDDCLATAKGLDREGLDKVIGLLRHARNEVVCKLGQKD